MSNIAQHSLALVAAPHTAFSFAQLIESAALLSAIVSVRCEGGG